VYRGDFRMSSPRFSEPEPATECTSGSHFYWAKAKRSSAVLRSVGEKDLVQCQRLEL